VKMSVESAITKMVTLLNFEVIPDKHNGTEMKRDQSSTLTKLHISAAANTRSGLLRESDVV
jgi:hypothetical protein